MRARAAVISGSLVFVVVLFTICTSLDRTEPFVPRHDLVQQVQQAQIELLSKRCGHEARVPLILIAANDSPSANHLVRCRALQGLVHQMRTEPPGSAFQERGARILERDDLVSALSRMLQDEGPWCAARLGGEDRVSPASVARKLQGDATRHRRWWADELDAPNAEITPKGIERVLDLLVEAHEDRTLAHKPLSEEEQLDVKSRGNEILEWLAALVSSYDGEYDCADEMRRAISYGHLGKHILANVERLDSELRSSWLWLFRYAPRPTSRARLAWIETHDPDANVRAAATSALWSLTDRSGNSLTSPGED